MAVTYEIDRRERVIRTRCVGDVSLEEVLGHFRALEADPGCPDALDVVLDLTEIESKPDAGDLRQVAGEMARVRDRVRFGACAIVVGSEVIFGASRMYVSVAGECFREAQVFRTGAEAEKWLALHRSA